MNVELSLPDDRQMILVDRMKRRAMLEMTIDGYDLMITAAEVGVGHRFNAREPLSMLRFAPQCARDRRDG
jgi:hypothetical protein